MTQTLPKTRKPSFFDICYFGFWAILATSITAYAVMSTPREVPKTEPLQIDAQTVLDKNTVNKLTQELLTKGSVKVYIDGFGVAEATLETVTMTPDGSYHVVFKVRRVPA